MHLTPREIDKLLIFSAGELARKRRARGLKLNHPEAVALITSEILELIRDGRSVAEIMSLGSTILAADAVMEGVPEMIPEIQVEGTLPDGTKLVTVHQPIQIARTEVIAIMKPGEYFLSSDPIELNAGRPTRRIEVSNRGDRPVQIGSHCHFFEVNRWLAFDRAAAYGMRLNVAAGTAVRFEPGDTREVELVAIGGTREIYGLNQLVEGPLDDEKVRAAALSAVDAFVKAAK